MVKSSKWVNILGGKNRLLLGILTGTGSPSIPGQFAPLATVAAQRKINQALLAENSRPAAGMYAP
jgi:hypothetical protein